MEQESFCLTEVLSVVWFDADGKGHIGKLPPGSTVSITGGRRSPGFIEILHQDRICHAFEEDFRERTVAARKAMAAGCQ